MTIRSVQTAYEVPAPAGAPVIAPDALKQAYAAMPGTRKFWFDPRFGLVDDPQGRLAWTSREGEPATLFSVTGGARPTVTPIGLDTWPTLDFTADCALEFDNPDICALNLTEWSFLVLTAPLAGQVNGATIVGSIPGANYTGGAADMMFGLQSGQSGGLWPRVFNMGANTQRLADSSPATTGWEIFTTTFTAISGEGLRLFRGGSLAASAPTDVTPLGDGRWKVNGRNTASTGRQRLATIMGANANWGTADAAPAFANLIAAFHAALPSLP